MTDTLREPAPGGGCVRRRTVLTAGGATVLGPALSACGSGSGGDPAGGAGAATSGPDGLHLDISGLEVGQSRLYLAARRIVTRTDQDAYVVLDATCPHQGCAVSRVETDRLVCPCHGSAFDPTSGAVLTGPAVSGLTVHDGTLDGTEIVVRG